MRSRQESCESGNVLPMVMGLMFLMAAIVTPISLHISKVSRSRHALNQVQMMSLAEARINNLLARRVDSCPLSDKFREFRDFSKSAKPIDMNGLGAVPCVFTDEELRFFSNLSIRVSETFLDTNTMSRKIEVRAVYTAAAKKGEGLIERTVSNIKNYQMRVVTMSSFGTIFTGGAAPLVHVAGGAVAHFRSQAFYIAKNPLELESIADIARQSAVFYRPFLIRSREFRKRDTGTLDLAKFGRTFTAGVEVGVFSQDDINAFLPDKSERWNHLVDQYYLQNSPFVVPLPQTRGGAAVASCYDTTLGFSATRASYTAIPSPASGIKSLSRTCAASTSSVPLLYHMKPDRDLVVTMSSFDNVLCGIIGARRLIFNLDGSGTFGFYGNIIADRIEIRTVNAGARSSSFFFENPEDNRLGDVELPPEQTHRGLLREFKMLESSLAFNLAVPAVPGSTFLPRTPDQFMTKCGASSLSYKSEYEPIHRLPGFDVLAKNSADAAIVAIEEVL